jgi:hypothetical protein
LAVKNLAFAALNEVGLQDMLAKKADIVCYLLIKIERNYHFEGNLAAVVDLGGYRKVTCDTLLVAAFSRRFHDVGKQLFRIRLVTTRGALNHFIN